MTESHRPLSLTPAPGWKAAFIWHDGTAPHSDLVPLVGWAVCHVTNYPDGEHLDTAIHGYTVQEERTVACAHDWYDELWRYLAPDDPEPTAAETQAEWDRRLQLDAHIKAMSDKRAAAS